MKHLFVAGALLFAVSGLLTANDDSRRLAESQTTDENRSVAVTVRDLIHHPFWHRRVPISNDQIELNIEIIIEELQHSCGRRPEGLLVHESGAIDVSAVRFQQKDGGRVAVIACDAKDRPAILRAIKNALDSVTIEQPRPLRRLP